MRLDDYADSDLSDELAKAGRRPTPKISELDFRRQIVGPNGLAELFGWEHVGFRPAMTSKGWRTPGTGSMAKGWPDLVLVRERDRRLIFAELKGEDGRLSDEQYRVLDVLRSLASPMLADRAIAGVEIAVPRIEVHIWRPSDFDRIVEILR